MKSLLVILLCWALLPLVQAQQDHHGNEQYRDVTAAGPFPIYTTLSRTVLLLNKDFKNWTGNGRGLFGLEFNLGYKIRRVLFEAGYSHISASPKNSSDRLTLNTYSVRIGWRNTFYYPLGMHVQGGIVLRDTRFRTESSGNIRTVAVFNKQLGAELRGRFTFLDPVGTGGGLGFYVEGRLHYFFDPDDFILPPAAAFQQDKFYAAVSLGVFVPIAIIKRR